MRVSEVFPILLNCINDVYRCFHNAVCNTICEDAMPPQYPQKKLNADQVFMEVRSWQRMKESMAQRAQSEREQLSHKICTDLAALFCLMACEANRGNPVPFRPGRPPNPHSETMWKIQLLRDPEQNIHIAKFWKLREWVVHSRKYLSEIIFGRMLWVVKSFRLLSMHITKQ
jgi:hypothetical protein